MPPVTPMLATSASVIPESGEWSHEPKWDGFRALIFRDGSEVVIGSRGGKDLARYFPEIVDAARAELPTRVVVDGEIGVPMPIGGVRRFDWDSLTQRIHPSRSRVTMLAGTTPAIFVAFDLLAVDTADVTGESFAARRDRLLSTIGAVSEAGARCRITRTTADPEVAARWFAEFEGAGLDGIVSKRLDAIYTPGKREMVKVKHARTADCVVMGYRNHKSGKGVGSILLGLYQDGELRMVGGIGAMTTADRRALHERFEPMRIDPDSISEGEPSRWKPPGSSRWYPIRPELVVEVAYDQMEGGRFRHTVRLVRWRPDRDPASCGYGQLDIPVTVDVDDVLEGGR